MEFTTPPLTIETPEGKTIAAGEKELKNIRLLFVISDNAEDARALVLGSFGFDVGYIESSGYTLMSIGSTISLSQVYCSPYTSAEVSRFACTVKDEICLGIKSLIPFQELILRLNCILELLDIEHLCERDPLLLSGGETAKVILASHMMQIPDVLVIDRTLSEFDTYSRRRILSRIKDCKLFQNTLFVTLDQADSIQNELADITWDLSTDKNISGAGYKISTTEYHLEMPSLTIRSLGTNPIKQEPSLIIEDITVFRGNNKVINRLSFSCSHGDLLWVSGANGTGKTTLFETLVGFHDIRNGRIKYLGKDMEKNLYKIISYSPQHPNYDITEKNLLDEIALQLRLNSNIDNISRNARSWLEEIDVDPLDIDKLIYMTVRDKKFASVLSCFARNKPLILLDEPTLFLSHTDMIILKRLINDHLRKNGIILLSSHDDRLINILSCMGGQRDTL